MVRLDDRFDSEARDSLLGAAREDLRLALPGEVLSDFQEASYELDEQNEVDGVQFLLASVHPRLAYLEVRMCRIVALLGLATGSGGVTTESGTYEFILRCIMKVWKHQLTDPFVDDFEEYWYRFRMVPDIAVPLTPFGISVLEHLWTNVGSYLRIDRSGTSWRDARSMAEAISKQAQLASDEVDASDRMAEVPR